MSVTSGTVEGFSVVLWPGVCHVSKGYYHATLEYLRQHFCLRDSRGAGLTMSPHQINIIKQWAKAHGYSQERRRGRTQESDIASDTFSHYSATLQRCLPLEVPASKPRRRARTEGSR